MSSDHFGQLPQLEDLQIKYCKLRTVPAAAFAGLNSLKRLTLQSHNAVIMEMHQDTFQVSSFYLLVIHWYYLSMERARHADLFVPLLSY